MQTLEEISYNFNKFLSDALNSLDQKILSCSSASLIEIDALKTKIEIVKQDALVLKDALQNNIELTNSVNTFISQINDRISLLENRSIDMSVKTFDELKQKLLEAGNVAKPNNKNVTVFLAQDVINFDDTIVIPPHVSLSSIGKGYKSTRLRYTGPEGESIVNYKPLVQQQNSYGSIIENIEITVANPLAKYLVAYNFSTAINCTLRFARFAHYGLDCRGLYISGRESFCLSDIDFRCSVPVHLGYGDNFNLHNIDIGASTTPEALIQMNKDLPSACLYINQKQDSLVLSGYQTYQGGNYAVLGYIDSPIFCSGMFFNNIRYEQSLSKQDPNIFAMDIIFANRHCESMRIGEGCRFSDRVAGIKIKNCWNLEISTATRITGSRLWNDFKWDANIKQWVLTNE